MGNKKYELLEDDTISVGGKTLYRIKAKYSFSNVSKGDLGGYIESEHNLLTRGACWVSDNAKVFDKARVWHDARVSGNALVYGKAELFDYAHVYDTAKVSGDALIGGTTVIYGNAQVYGNANIYGKSVVRGKTIVKGDYEGKDVHLVDGKVYDGKSKSQVLTKGSLGKIKY
jgi:carbonic anhydrase/acetyltransferase-like protein (isoleucine patch superfamily)